MAASPDAVLHLAALHTLAHAGFASTSRAASLNLSSILARYLRLVAEECTGRAALAGRSKVAAVDVVTTLQDLGVGGIGELQEWTVSIDKEVSFVGTKMEELECYLRDGLTISEGVEAHFVPVESDDEVDAEEEDAMDIDDDAQVKIEEVLEEPAFDIRTLYRPKSPDMSWLPPLPTDNIIAGTSGLGTVAAPMDSAPAPLSVADRYRRPIAFASSTLAENHQWMDPPHSASPPEFPPAPSSFPYLISTYAAVKGEPSVALRQTDGRRQAADLLRLTVGNPGVFTTEDTLSIPLPPPRISPIVPSHSESLPPKLLPVNPNQNGIVSSLLQKIRSPYLPPSLRERLTALRPPQAQQNDAGPILFGPAVRGADESALAKARGKATGNEPEFFFRATWDSGPRGMERWSKGGLPAGKKVVQHVEGEKFPRESAGAKALRLKINEKAPGIVDAREASPGAASSPKVTLRLGAPKPPDRGHARFSPRSSIDAGSSFSFDSNVPSAAAFFRPPGDHHDKSKSNSRSTSPSKRYSPQVKQEPMMFD
ncbi:hypothetical protein CcaverHIS002_0111650 [Cutaneotrichosporon cavernicola]|uniref:Bromodomain associated domain-containing protein n=1 Tax=Cutaneotrichosporon cavernicola TaxID=279322 RepID=A0AA48I309_9TREE|nr:uncharacterized protein CcaverHIS019_0111550 [Cutaneotrichosporon cavernicola]BEI80636.1 hypothetical protein CcaverHIS002_0111650 [Cutaneotrichosporon cavernicola]BEI88437.1 hypothetical protein CcaverHIS019_0111550 [Cutaneotrichosporon cavernicola]BEI96210.1 hypothetical protein CcaverHIS631_0111590 [Cutaneotrichosporon cavernicola]BEJ03981.1 hypothetical protein CcaverHIS641_0111560 [Cutaneotrichosporon cavernicola]